MDIYALSALDRRSSSAGWQITEEHGNNAPAKSINEASQQFVFHVFCSTCLLILRMTIQFEMALVAFGDGPSQPPKEEGSQK